MDDVMPSIFAEQPHRFLAAALKYLSLVFAAA
jgi:hypothetical protein